MSKAPLVLQSGITGLLLATVVLYWADAQNCSQFVTQGSAAGQYQICFDVWNDPTVGITQAQFFALNPGINCNALQSGQQLCIRGAGAPAAAPTAAAPSAPANCPRTYLVSPGDSCSSIELRNALSTSAFESLNPNINCNLLLAGAPVCLPAAVPCARTYVVPQGSNCSAVWSQFRLTPQQLQDLNPGLDCGLLQTNTTLCVAAPPSGGSNTGAIVGGVVGGVAALALAAVVVALHVRRRRRQRCQQKLHGAYSHNSRGQSVQEHSASPGLPVYKAFEPDTGPSVLDAAPGQYAALPELQSDKGLMTGSSQSTLTGSMRYTGTSTDSRGSAGRSPGLLTLLGSRAGSAARAGSAQTELSKLSSSELIGSGHGSAPWIVDPDDLEWCLDAGGNPIILGRGGFGEVYKALWQKQTIVAVKVMREQTDKAQQSFLKEIEVLCSLRHPNVVSFYGAYAQGDTIMLVTEFMPRGDLYHALNSSQQPGAWWRRGRHIALDVARGLVYMHQANILHLDVKSCNVLLAGDATAKVADVGLSKMISNSVGTKASGIGTLDWAAPEMVMCQPCSKASDVFSFGVVLWEICSGEQPVRRQYRALRVPEEGPPEVVDLVQDCMQQDPRERPTMQEVLQRLAAALKIPPPPQEGTTPS